MLTREAVVGEGIEGGFSAVYPVLRALEEAGRIRRGYFVDGLGAAQFALAGALDRLRAVREPSDADPLDRGPPMSSPPPTRPTRTARPCPGRDAARTIAGRSSGRQARTSCWSMARRPCTSSVAARPLQVLSPADDPAVATAALRALAVLVADGRFRELVVTQDRRAPVAESPFRAALLESGFVPGYRGLTLRASGAGDADASLTGPTRPCPRATRSIGPPPGCARTSSVGR